MDISDLREATPWVKSRYISIIILDTIESSRLYEGRSESLIAEPCGSTFYKSECPELSIGIEDISIGLSW